MESTEQQVVDTTPKFNWKSEGASGINMRSYLILVAFGAFATTFAQQKLLGQYPTTFLLKEKMHFAAQQVAMFYFWVTFAWNLKPIAGILADAFPIFGTRRRHYMIIGAIGAAAMWAGMGFSSTNYPMLVTFSLLMNVCMVFASTVMGGLQVEAGQTFGAPGRITALRQFVQTASGVAAPYLGGMLATQAFGYTAGLAATVLLALGAVAFVYLKERPRDMIAEAAEVPLGTPDYMPSSGLLIGIVAVIAIGIYLFITKGLTNLGISVLAQIAVFISIILVTKLPSHNAVVNKAQHQLVQIFQSKALWMAVGMLFLVYTVPGLNTALTFRQSDVLKFDKTYIGLLESLGYFFGAMAAVVYVAVCRKFNLRIMLVVGIAANAAATLLYLVYTKQSAPWIHSVGGMGTYLSELALMDMAVRSTPKGCEALGFSLMMSVRNFGLAMSDILGTKMLEQGHMEFNSLVWINAGTTFVILLFVPFLPKVLMSKREGD